MINLIKLDLLPYRELALQEMQKRFARMIVLAVVLGLALAVMIYLFISQLLGIQESRNEFLSQKIDALDKQIVEVRSLESEKKAFLMRKQKIEELQNERFKAAMILHDLNNLMPDSVYLTQLQSQDGKLYTLKGRALSDDRVAALMRSLPSTGLFTAPELLGIKSVDGAQEFQLRTRLVDYVNDSSTK